MPIRDPKPSLRPFLILLAACLAAALPFVPWPLRAFLLVAALPLAVRSAARDPGFRSGSAPVLPPPPAWAWAALLVAAAIVRFAVFPSVHAWPLFDESLHNAFALEPEAPGSLYYGAHDLPGLFVDAMAAAYRLFGVGLGVFWAVPALLSTAAVVLAAVVSRRLLPPGGAFAFTALLAFGYWPIVAGGLSHAGSLTVPWLLLCALVLIPPRGSRLLPLRAAAGGLLAGAGAYTFTSWYPLLLWASAFLMWWHRRDRRVLLSYGAGTVLALAPAFLHFSGSRGRYLGELFLPAHFSRENLLAAFSNVFQVLGAPPVKGLAYSPVWGGFLDPVAGALALLGLLHLWTRRREAAPAFLLTALPVLTAPGWLSTTVEMYRVFPILPVLLSLCALGLAVAARGTRRRAFAIAAAMICTSSVWNAFHLGLGYRGEWGAGARGDFKGFKTAEQWRAFEALSATARAEGPGELLVELVPETFDQSLRIACVPFDARRDPRLAAGDVRWRALLTDPHLKPELERRLGPGRWVWLSRDLRRFNGGLALAVFPADPGRDAAWDRLREADRAWEAVTRVSLLGVRLDRPWPAMTAAVEATHPRVKGDRLLETFYWRKVARYRMGLRDWEGAKKALATALERGLPTASLHADLGALASLTEDPAEAARSFRKARSMEPDLTLVPE
jgi:hypothetical protein